MNKLICLSASLGSLFLLFFCQIVEMSTGEINLRKSTKTILEHRMISSGDNYPDFDPAQDSLDYFLMALHQGTSINKFKFRKKIPDDHLKFMAELLVEKKWAYYSVTGNLKPSVFIASEEDGSFLFSKSDRIAFQIAHTIEERLGVIRQAFNKSEISKKQSFEQWSFFVLSDVLLDSWQIENVEKYFLKQKVRPERNSKNYFFAIMENSNQKEESFGIYGNQYRQEENRTFGVYGNRRDLGSSQNKNHLISKKDETLFVNMANDFAPVLIKILEINRQYILNTYRKSPYFKETTFEEFFIWWYHFIYTKATNIMGLKKILKIPSGGNFEYEILP